MEKDYRSYNVKVVETASTIEFWEYLNEPVVYSVDLYEEKERETSFADIEQDFLEKEEEEEEELTSSSFYDSLKRKQKHYEEMRWEIARLIDCNFDDNTKFMTLTFKENIQDIKYTNYEFAKFIKRLNYYLYQKKKQCLKYLAVWEKQERGSIHYHIVFFSFPFIKFTDLSDVWGHGFVKINKIDVDSKDNRGRYVSKYFSKEVDEKEYKNKAFFKSQNLIKPIVKRITIDERIDFSNDDVVYSKTYSRTIPDFASLQRNLEMDNSLSFKKSTVLYTKIRKEVNNDYDY